MTVPGVGAVVHWAVEVPDGDRRPRLVNYQTRERAARLAAEAGSYRLLSWEYRETPNGSRWYGPRRYEPLAGLIELPKVDRLYFVYRPDNDLPVLGGWRNQQAALDYARTSGGQVVYGIDVVYVAMPPFQPEGGDVK